jgi:hypothetical protein
MNIISKSKSTCELQISVEIRDRTFCLIKNYDQLDYTPYRYDCNILHSWFCLHSIFKRFLHTYMTLVRWTELIFQSQRACTYCSAPQEKSSAKEDEITMPLRFVITIMVYLSFWPFVNFWERNFTLFVLISAVTKLNKGSELLFD